MLKSYNIMIILFMYIRFTTHVYTHNIILMTYFKLHTSHKD